MTSEYRLVFNEVVLRCWSYFNFLCGIGVQVEKNGYFLFLFFFLGGGVDAFAALNIHHARTLLD